ncbi:AraC family transcriptional regulator [Clostridium cavendishii DSM 21758]|uniref:AraC family transcriptional regulator n=1 Tax=Clostridium cavendishii DSM 21758 TaxID=1121302 RepID=A0A1M6NLT0_9CLOT|nr:AraC family transcriptional regulator [Clostridium cavendishii]SHJ96650.1 AraC family transcriptional regulator [Clostridium cavendishii DSM 21758]
MDLLNCMNNAMDYIELHLTDTIEYKQLAKISCCSVYHFQRMFSFISGIPLSEYIRRRKLTLAAIELQNKNTKIIDIAMKYGYQSPEAFSRAFKNMHDVSPTAARSMGITLKAYPKMTFYLSIKGGIEMNYRIEKKEAFEVFGVASTIKANNQETAFIEVPKFCTTCDENGSVDRMNTLLGRSHDTMLHAALYNHTENSFKYMICEYVPNNINIPKEYERLSIPALTWAIFPADNCDIPTVWQRIYSDWFPTSDFEQVEGPQFEMYYGKAHNSTGEVWIPVKSK